MGHSWVYLTPWSNSRTAVHSSLSLILSGTNVSTTYRLQTYKWNNHHIQPFHPTPNTFIFKSQKKWHFIIPHPHLVLELPVFRFKAIWLRMGVYMGCVGDCNMEVTSNFLKLSHREYTYSPISLLPIDIII